LGLTVVSKFTYTLESLIQAGKSLVAVADVPVSTNPTTRESRLFGSMWSYVGRNAMAIFRIYAGYEPLQVFTGLAVILLVGAFAAWSPFLWDWIINGNRGGHLQSIVLGGVLFVASIQTFALGVLADLIGAHRVVTQRTLERVRRIELQLGVRPSHYMPGHRGDGADLGPMPSPAPGSAARAGDGAPGDGSESSPDLGQRTRI
jgi:hypothetical protein